MLTWLRRLIVGPTAPQPRIVTLVNRLDDLDARVDYLGAELKALRGRVVARERKPEPVEPEPVETTEQREQPRILQSAHLARRFRGA